MSEIDRKRLSVIIKAEVYLRLLEIDCTGLEAFLAHLLGKCVQCLYLIIVQSLAFLYYFLYLVVTETVVTVDDSACNVELLHLGLFVHGKDYRIGKLVLVRTQRAKVVAKTLGKHWNGAVHKIYLCGTLECLLVYHAAFGNIVRHIGNVDTHLPQSLTCRTD